MHRITTPLANRMGILFNWVTDCISYYNNLYFLNFRLLNVIRYFFNSAMSIKWSYFTMDGVAVQNRRIFVRDSGKEVSLLVSYTIPRIYNIPPKKHKNWQSQPIKKRKKKKYYIILKKNLRLKNSEYIRFLLYWGKFILFF